MLGFKEKQILDDDSYIIITILFHVHEYSGTTTYSRTEGQKEIERLKELTKKAGHERMIEYKLEKQNKNKKKRWNLL